MLSWLRDTKCALRLGVMVCFGGGLIGQALADTVTLRTGRQIEGAIIQETASEVVVQTAVGQVRLSRREVAGIERSQREAEEVQAERALSQGNYREAVRQLQRLVERARTAGNAETQRRAEVALESARNRERAAVERELGQKLATARAARTAGNPDRAFELAQAALATMLDESAQRETRRFMAELKIEKAAQARDRQDTQRELRELQAAASLDPEFYTAQLLLGRMLLDSVTSQSEGLEMIQQALRLGSTTLTNEERARFHYLLGDRFFRQRMFQEAASNFVAVLGIPDPPRELADALDRAVECYVNIGETGMASGSERTLEGLSEALALNPRNIQALFLMGQLQFQTSQFAESIATMERLVSIDPNQRMANAFIGRSAMALNDYDRALRAFDAELALNPNNYDILCERAELRILTADYTGARTDIERAKSLQVAGVRAFLIEAQLNIIDEKFDEAQASLQGIIARATNVREKLEPYLQMGRVLARKKESDDARKWFQTVADFLMTEVNNVGSTTSLPLRFRSILADTKVELGRLNLEQDNPRTAEENFREAMTIVEDYPPALIGIGDVRRRLGDEPTDQAEKDRLYREAESFYKRALAINPRDPDVVLKLAILYHRFMKDPERARVEYRRYLDLGGRDQAVAQQGLDEIGAETMAADQATTATVDADTQTTPSASNGNGGAEAPQ
jgi:tetratricopeptide (TPR) repeat protein